MCRRVRYVRNEYDSRQSSGTVSSQSQRLGTHIPMRLNAPAANISDPMTKRGSANQEYLPSQKKNHASGTGEGGRGQEEQEWFSRIRPRAKQAVHPTGAPGLHLSPNRIVFRANTTGSSITARGYGKPKLAYANHTRSLLVLPLFSSQDLPGLVTSSCLIRNRHLRHFAIKAATVGSA